jgi:hypothetical protein
MLRGGARSSKDMLHDHGGFGRPAALTLGYLPLRCYPEQSLPAAGAHRLEYDVEQSEIS